MWDAPISRYAVRAYRIADGSRAWGRVGSIGGETIAAGGRVLVVGDDAGDGRRLWTASFADDGPIEITVGGGVVYGWRGGGHPLAAFEARTGRPIGLDARTSVLQGAPMVANGRLYGRTASAVVTYAP
ncbi:hypothetical protein ACQP2X_12805 [Actinoplanes sp. CA-131856]